MKERIKNCRECDRFSACFLAEEIKSNCCMWGCMAWPKGYADLPFDPIDQCEMFLRTIGGRCSLYKKKKDAV